MRPGWYWIFFRPCRMTWIRWAKLVTQATGEAAIETVRSGIADLGKDPQEQQEQDGPRRVRQPGGEPARRPRTGTRACRPPR